MTGGDKARRAVNDPMFRSMSNIETVADMYEINKAYKRISLNLPIYLGVNILLESKRLMCFWHYNFLSIFIERAHFSHIIMDTDAIYTQFAFETLEASVKPSMREEFQNRLENYCGTERHPEGMMPRTCCDKCNFLDARTPLLMKREYVAKLMISLCPKTYVCLHRSGEGVKLSCKGVQKALVKSKDPVRMYRDVLETGVADGSLNRGFRSLKGRMYSYSVFRQAFPYLYLKREVLPGGKFTKCLQNVVLDPCPVYYFCLHSEAKELTLDSGEKPFTTCGYTVQTIRQAMCISKYALCTNQDKNPMRHSVRLFAAILKTTDANTLVKLHAGLGECEEYEQNQFSILMHIVERRMQEYPGLYNLLVSSGRQLIVNGCQYDRVLGTGSNFRECRYRKGAFLEGMNLLGKVYMTLRVRLNRVLRN